MSNPRDDLAALIKDIFDEFDLPDRYDIADAILAAGYVKPKPPTITPDHDINMERAPYCTVCGRDIQWDDNTESWQH